MCGTRDSGCGGARAAPGRGAVAGPRLRGAETARAAAPFVSLIFPFSI